jgi:hypothetical protein
MSLLTYPDASASARRLDSSLVVMSVALLSVLALADRAAAWLIGEFPASAIVWQLRFEFLRPIGVYYDFAILSLGHLSTLAFCGIVLAAAGLIVAGARSRIRLLRALAYHVLCGLAVILWACSLQYHEGVYAPVGVPSTLYALMGAALAVPAAALCLGVHAEYVGWNPASSTMLRRANIARRRAQRRLDGAVSDLFDRLGAALPPKQIVLAPLRIVNRTRSDR